MTRPTPSSKERVLTAFARQEPDRVPINYSANAGIDARLKAHLGLASTDDEGLYRALGVDFRGVSAPYVGPRLHPEAPGRRVDACWGMHTRWIAHESGGYWDYCDFPLASASSDEVANWPMPSPDDYDYRMVPEQCRRHQGSAVFIGGAGLGDIINSTGFLLGMEETLIRLICGDEILLSFLDRRLEVQLMVAQRELEAARGAVDFLWMGEDLGSQIAPMISLQLYRQVIRPRHQRVVDLAKAYDLPVMIHSCGYSSWAYDDFIEMGISVVDTLQPEAAHMSPPYLKERYGGRLAFHGCISTAGPVAYGTVEDVVASCRETLAIMMPGGGYCFAPTHALQDNSPTENVVAMYETARSRGRYA